MLTAVSAQAARKMGMDASAPQVPISLETLSRLIGATVSPATSAGTTSIEEDPIAEMHNGAKEWNVWAHENCITAHDGCGCAETLVHQALINNLPEDVRVRAPHLSDWGFRTVRDGSCLITSRPID